MFAIRRIHPEFALVAKSECTRALSTLTRRSQRCLPACLSYPVQRSGPNFGPTVPVFSSSFSGSSIVRALVTKHSSSMNFSSVAAVATRQRGLALILPGPSMLNPSGMSAYLSTSTAYPRKLGNAFVLNFSMRHCLAPRAATISLSQSKRSLSINPLDRWQFRENAFWGEQVLYLIIGINVLVFFLWQNVNLRRFMTDHFTISTSGVLREGRFHTLLTAVFSHNGMGHLIANMITLWFFGAEIIALLGARRFLQLYVGGGLVSSVCQVAWPLIAPKLNIPSRNRSSASQLGLGASGAVNSVVALSILVAPSRTILLYFFIPVPSAVLGCLFLGKDLAGLYYGDTGIGNAAHLGGTFYGAAFWAMLRRRPFHY